MAVSPSPRNFPGDADFAISFWFTRTQCTVPSGDEYLYSQRQSWTGSRARGGGREDEGAEIDLRIACQTDGETTISSQQIAGAVLRVALRDNSGKEAQFDVPLSAELTGGYVDDMWAHFILSVSATGNNYGRWYSSKLNTFISHNSALGRAPALIVPTRIHRCPHVCRRIGGVLVSIWIPGAVQGPAIEHRLSQPITVSRIQSAWQFRHERGCNRTPAIRYRSRSCSWPHLPRVLAGRIHAQCRWCRC